MAARRDRTRIALGGLAAGIGVLAAVTAGTTPASPSFPAGRAVTDTPVRVLQMNLCGSGLAPCYTGRSVVEAAAVIRQTTPDLVTLNEVCREDVITLAAVMGGGVQGGGVQGGGVQGGGVHGDAVVAAFEPARDRRTGGPFRCRDGRQYGIGLIGRQWPATGRSAVTTSGVYPDQDPRQPEERVWLCVDTGAYTACTTHLANLTKAVAAAQCRHLLDAVLPLSGPVVLAGDLNLRGGSPEMRSCVPRGNRRSDDGGVQDVVAGAGFTVTGRRQIDLRGTTDHPALLVTLTLGADPPVTGTS